MTLSNTQISAIGIGCLALVIFIVFVPIIAVDTNTESTSLAVCITTPCEDMVVKEQKTILEFISDRENVEFLTPLAPDNLPDDVGACIEIYQPVCGTDGNTYGNECKLNLSENVEIDHQGEC